MKATLLTIGDELLIGQVVNTNAAWLGEQLGLLGVEVACAVTVGDAEDAIQSELARALAATELVVLTGGLGPTHDDVTVEAVAGFFEAALEPHAAVLAGLQARYTARGRPMPASNRKLALVPAGFEVLNNSAGAAPGLWYEERRPSVRRLVVVLPGVPREMKALFTEEVGPRLRALDGLPVVVHRTLLTAGIGESNLQEALGDLAAFLGPTLRLAYLPASGSVRLRLSATGASRAAAEAQVARLEAHLRRRVGPHLFGEGDETLEAVLGRLLQARGLTLAVAESCTGGLVLDRLTNVPGASAYVLGGVVAYANAAKEAQLGVDPAALASEGAVSETVARQMARGVRQRFGADLGLATTGVAGPGGGSPEKPVGTVWLGLADASGTFARCHHFGADRLANKARSATTLLDLVRRHLLGLDEGI